MQDEEKYTLLDFKKLSNREQQAWLASACCLLVFVLVASLSTVLIFKPEWAAENPNGTEQQSTSQEPGPAESVLLPRTDDGGDDYINETVFVGDSNTVRLYRLGAVGLDSYMGAEGLGVAGITTAACVYFVGTADAYTIPQALYVVQPRRVILTLGTNDADGAMSKEDFLQAYRDMIATIREATPYTDIIINAIPPIARTNSYPNLTPESIQNFNDALLGLATQENLKFLNSTEVLADAEGYAQDGVMEEDGLHFTGAGAQTLINYVRTHQYETQDSRPARDATWTRKEQGSADGMQSEPRQTLPPAVVTEGETEAATPESEQMPTEAQGEVQTP